MTAAPGGAANRLARGALGRQRLGRGLRRGRGRRVPSAHRRRHVEGIVGLGFGGKGLDRELCRRQRLGIEALGNIVALVGSVRVALRRRQAEPFEGFGKVLFDADAAGIEDAEIELAVRDAAIGGQIGRASCRERV